MLFNSIGYAIFLPIVFFIYWMIPDRYRWSLLLVASYYFYMSWNIKYVLLIILITVVSYLAGLTIEKADTRLKKRLVLMVTIVFCLGILFFFKYFNFVNNSVAAFLKIFSININPITLKILLPVGISFYTFQTMSYVIDVYRGNVSAERNLGIYATFISFFPQLVAGPIERTSNLLPQIKKEKIFDYDLAMFGARQMLWGFFKKMAVADVVSTFVDRAYDNLLLCTGFDLVIAIFLFTIQIYCDFSGYSDIAIGTSKLLGINLTENFKSPYFSCSIKEFWSRWHISLSTWFRDYLYIPLGGNRCSKRRTYMNLAITFAASGFWHGANWTFFFWGMIHGCFQIIERVFRLDSVIKKKNKFLSWLIVFCVCNIAWIFFRADNLAEALLVLKLLLSKLLNLSSFFHTEIGLSFKMLIYLAFTIGLVGLFDYYSLSTDVIQYVSTMQKGRRIVLEYLILSIIVGAILLSAGSNQFVYFQF